MGEELKTPADALSAACDEIRDLQGENAVLRDILLDAYEVIKTIEPENSEESERLCGLRMAIESAAVIRNWPAAILASNQPSAKLDEITAIAQESGLYDKPSGESNEGRGEG